jgi:RNA polymerase sigma-70 factor (ECF subfamily)
MLGDKDMAADVAQESFIQFYNSLQNGDTIKNPSGWLYTCVRNRCLNIFRDNRKKVDLNAAERLIYESANGNDDRRQIRSSLQKLDSKHREALVLREYHRLSYDEMAEVLDISRAGVRSLLYKARLALKKVYFEINDARIKP